MNRCERLRAVAPLGATLVMSGSLVLGVFP